MTTFWRYSWCSISIYTTSSICSNCNRRKFKSCCRIIFTRISNNNIFNLFSCWGPCTIVIKVNKCLGRNSISIYGYRRSNFICTIFWNGFCEGSSKIYIICIASISCNEPSLPCTISTSNINN